MATKVRLASLLSCCGTKLVYNKDSKPPSLPEDYNQDIYSTKAYFVFWVRKADAKAVNKDWTKIATGRKESLWVLSSRILKSWQG